MPRQCVVLGGSGFLGRAVAERLAIEHSVTATFAASSGRDTGPLVRWRWPDDRLGPLLDRLRVELVVIAAALARASGPGVAAGHEQAFAEIASACRGRRVVYVSSDAVFAGDRGRYREQDAPRPVTPYGARQLRSEQLLAGEIADLCIVRTSYLYGHSAGELDSRLSATRARLGRGECVELYGDVFKSPVPVGVAAAAIAALAPTALRGVVHLPGPRVSVWQFQRDALAVLGAPVERLLATPAPTDQPRDTSLDGGRCTALTGLAEVPIAEGMVWRQPGSPALDQAEV